MLFIPCDDGLESINTQNLVACMDTITSCSKVLGFGPIKGYKIISMCQSFRNLIYHLLAVWRYGTKFWYQFFISHILQKHHTKSFSCKWKKQLKSNSMMRNKESQPSKRQVSCLSISEVVSYHWGHYIPQALGGRPERLSSLSWKHNYPLIYEFVPWRVDVLIWNPFCVPDWVLLQTEAYDQFFSL